MLLLLVLLFSVASAAVPDVQCNYENCYLLTDTGELYGWGYNHNGELGTGSTDEIYPAAPVLIDTKVKSIARLNALAYHTLWLKEDGTVWGCGNGGYYQITPDANDYVVYPRQVGGWGGKTVDYLVAMKRGSMALMTDGSVYAWGANWECAMSDSGDTYLEFPTVVYENVALLATGHKNTYVITNQGDAYCIGYNVGGIMGTPAVAIGGYTCSWTPCLMGLPQTPTMITSGYDNALFLMPTGDVWGAGICEEFSGNTGTYTGTDCGKQAVFAGVSNAVWIASGDEASTFVQKDGTLIDWEWYNEGGKPMGPRADLLSLPVSTVYRQAMGDYDGIIIMSDGTVYEDDGGIAEELPITVNLNGQAPTTCATRRQLRD